LLTDGNAKAGRRERKGAKTQRRKEKKRKKEEDGERKGMEEEGDGGGRGCVLVFPLRLCVFASLRFILIRVLF
jgi:hypothetical protein